MSIIKSLSVGNGDMFYIKHNSDNFSIIDSCMNEDNRENIVEELQREANGKNIVRFISTHPDDDHIRGLYYLNEQWPILNFYCVKNEASKEDETDDFNEYCNLKDSDKAFYLEKGCKRYWMNQANEARGSAGIHILWPITSNKHYKEALEQARKGSSPNNISPIIQYSLQDGAEVLWMGDLETDFMENIEDDVSLEEVDILFAPHHGRDSGKVPTSWLEKLDPQIIVIGEAPSEHLNYYQGFDTIKQNSAGELLFECVENAVHIYIENPSYEEDFLDDENKSGKDGLHYLGTLRL
ncbi:MAG: MBL fold metallo-hydrolase [Nitrospira sp.]|nr:MBL fold metallo-hydrolase [Nitrospira sp.]